MKKPNSTKTLFLVELVKPQGISDTAMAQFIANAISAEVGHYMPEEPFYHLDRDTIDVKHSGRVLTGITNALKDLRELQATTPSRAKPQRS